MACDCDSVQQTRLNSVEEALSLLLAGVQPLEDLETLGLEAALGRVLAFDVVSDMNVPPHDNSAMDGYVLHTEDMAGEQTRLPLSGRICAGDVPSEHQRGTAERIFTGAPIPAGADMVVMQELCEAEDGQVLIKTPAKVGSNIRKAGEDIQQGQVVLERGRVLRPQELGLLASVGVAEVSVYRRLKVAVFFTGDELKNPGETLAPGQIYNTNQYTLTGLLQRLGCEVIPLGIVADTLEATKTALTQAAKEADLIMTSGGVSVGEEDYVRIALEQLGQLNLWRIAMKPGKPLAFGHIDGVSFIGLPGNPVSVFATFCMIARDVVAKMQGRKQISAAALPVMADFDWKKAGPRREFVRVRLQTNREGQTCLGLYPHQGSGVLMSTSWADGMAVIPEHSQVQTGELLAFYSFNELLS